MKDTILKYVKQAYRNVEFYNQIKDLSIDELDIMKRETNTNTYTELVHDMYAKYMYMTM